MSRFWTVLGKEWKDARRDRRSVFAALLFSFFGPAMVAALVFFMAQQVEESESPDSEVVIAGAEYAPALIDAIERAGITVIRNEEAGPDLVRSGDADAVLIIDENFQEAYLASVPATVTLYTDETQRFAGRAVNAALNRYARTIRDNRLLVRGVAPIEVRTLDVQRHDVSTGGAVASSLADLIMYFFIFAPFYASMGMAMDMTAGERERDSLQPLLLQPVKPLTLMLGKWGVASLFGIAGSVITVLLGAFVIDVAPIETLGTSLSFSPMTQFLMILVLVPLALLVSAVQMTVALLARSFREAQTYISLLSFAPVILGLYTILSDSNDLSPFMPILLQIDQLNSLAFGETLDPIGIAVSIGTTIVVAGGCLLLSAGMLRRERMLQTN